MFLSLGVLDRKVRSVHSHFILNESLGGLLQQVSLDFVLLEVDSLLLVLLLNHLNHALELHSAVVASLSSGHVRESAHLPEVHVALVEQPPHYLAQTGRSVASDDLLVEVLEGDLLQLDHDRRDSRVDHAHATTSSDVHFLLAETLANNHLFDVESVL